MKRTLVIQHNTNRCLRNARKDRHRSFSAASQLVAITIVNSEVSKDIENRTNR